MDKPDTASNIAQLPKDIQELFEDSALSDAVFEIADKHEITGGKELNILLATEGVLTGLVAPVDFIKILSDALGVPWEKAALIAQDVNRSVFNYVKDSLKEIHKVAPTTVAPTAHSSSGQAPQFGGLTSKAQVAFATRSGGLKEEVPPPQVSPLSGYFDSAVKKAAAEAVRPVQETAPQQTKFGGSTSKSQEEVEPQRPTVSTSLFEQKLSGAFRVPQVAPPPVPPVPQKPLVQQTAPQSTQTERGLTQKIIPPGVVPRAPKTEVAPPTSQEEERPLPPPVPQKPKSDPYREKI